MTAKKSTALCKIQTVRAYEITDRDRGYRVLVDRIWPRGIAKEALALDEWAKDLAPSTELRRWFNHEPRRWAGFRKRYFSELDANADAVEGLLRRVKRRTLLLIYGARDSEHNNAVALRDYLSGHAT